MRGVGVECKLVCGSIAVGGGLGVIQVEYRRKAVPAEILPGVLWYIFLFPFSHQLFTPEYTLCRKPRVETGQMWGEKSCLVNDESKS